VPDPARRIELIRRLTPFPPLFIALSTSSPFWRCSNTGLKGYRLAAYDELPRTGIPELFESEDDYNAYVDALVRAGCIQDASHIWWPLRPSLKYPTIELRAPDCCTRLEDAMAIACLFRALTWFLFRTGDSPPGAGMLIRSLAVENKWRAQRYGVGATFVTPSGSVSSEAAVGLKCCGAAAGLNWQGQFRA
jgi:carboxylate-amine ligase